MPRPAVPTSSRTEPATAPPSNQTARRRSMYVPKNLKRHADITRPEEVSQLSRIKYFPQGHLADSIWD